MRRSLPTRALVRLLIPLAVLATAALAPAAAHAVDCPPVLATDDVTTGMTGTGWTVAQGRTKVPFDVEVLGVAHDAVGSGRDLIIVEVDSPEIDAAGGIWAGMSGSPVYVGGQLLGSVSYGFSFGPSKIGGVTPAEDMINLLGLPSLTAASARPAPRSFRLNRALARVAAERSGAALEQASSLRQLRVPLSMSGLSASGMKMLANNFKSRQSDAFIPYAGTSADRIPTAVGDPLQDGENFAGVVSYGDVTAAGVGTATYVCGGQALAFGHPFLFGGSTALGANAADAFAIIPDAVYGSYKFAEIAETYGVIDQDRLAGLRVSLGAPPEAIPIRTYVRVPELNRFRAGLTEVVMNDWAGYLTFASLISNMESTFDASGTGSDFAGRGTANLWWTFEGERADGTPWKLSRGNRYASIASILSPVVFEPAIMLDSLIWNSSEAIKVTSAQVSVMAEKAVRIYKIKDVLVGTGNGKLRPRGRLAVHRGSTLRIRVIMSKYTGGTLTKNYTFKLPKNRPVKGTLVVGGGAYLDDGWYDYGSDFESMLESFQTFPRNDQLVAGILRGRNGFTPMRNTRMNGVVRGFRVIQLLPDGSAGPSYGFDGFERVAKAP